MKFSELFYEDVLVESMRCTQATLEALGVKGVCPRTGTGVIGALTDAGIKWKPIVLDRYPTVQKFVKDNPKGSFYLSTRGHAMALVDGELIDTELKGPNKRKLQAIIEIIK
jgi:hypothetical protein